MELCYANNPKSLFKKYARLITWFSRTQLGRDYLGVPKDIRLMLPNGYLHEGQGTFYTRPVYFPKLSPALRKIDMVSNWIKNAQEAKEFLLWQLNLLRKPAFVPRLATAIMFKDDTFYPDPHEEVSSVDGKVYRFQASGEDWAVMQPHTDGTAAADDEAALEMIRIRCDANANKWDIILRGIFLFDTSSLPLPDTTTISDGVLTLFGQVAVVNDFTDSIALVSSNPALDTVLGAADYNQLGTTLFANLLAVSAWNDTGVANPFTLLQVGINAISVDDITKFGVRSEADRANAEPAYSAGNQTQVFCYGAEQAGIDLDPKLVVTYPIPPDSSVKSDVLTTYYSGCAYDWKLSTDPTAKNRGYQG